MSHSLVRSFALVLATPFACTAPEPAREQPRVEAPALSESSTAALEPSLDEAPPPLAEPAEPVQPTPSERAWWCLCYRSKTDTGEQPATACREWGSQCWQLEQRIAAGGRGIIKNSLTHNCRRLLAEHPGDVTGGRARWQPSKLDGAHTSEGACLLTDIPETPARDDQLFMYREHLSFLQIGMSAQDVLTRLGEPSERGEFQQDFVTPDFIQRWRYAKFGLDVFMRSRSRDGAQAVDALRISGSSHFMTKRGVELGARRADVLRIYADAIDPAGLDPDDPSSIVAGPSGYGGLVFQFGVDAGRDQVVEIFLGSFAE